VTQRNGTMGYGVNVTANDVEMQTMESQPVHNRF
jgi:hypothetical protein